MRSNLPSFRISRTGFSLLELVLVLATIVVLGAIAAPRFGMANVRYRADFAAQRIVADLVLAKMAAQPNGITTTAAFSPDQDRYQISGVAALDGPGTYSVDLSGLPYDANLTVCDFNGISTLGFDTWGIPDANGTVTLTVGTEQRTITVEASTGDVMVK